MHYIIHELLKLCTPKNSSVHGGGDSPGGANATTDYVLLTGWCPVAECAAAWRSGTSPRRPRSAFSRARYSARWTLQSDPRPRYTVQNTQLWRQYKVPRTASAAWPSRSLKAETSHSQTLYRRCTVVSTTSSATFSTDSHHIWTSHKRPCFICFVVWPTTSLKYDF